MSRFKMTPEEIEVIKQLRKDAKVCGCTIPEYLNQVVDWAYEFVISEGLPDDNELDELAGAIKAKIEQSNPSLSDWSVGEKGEIIITEDTGK